MEFVGPAQCVYHSMSLFLRLPCSVGRLHEVAQCPRSAALRTCVILGKIPPLLLRTAPVA